MKKTLIMVLMLGLAMSMQVTAQDIFEAGGTEIGGEFHLTYLPDGYITDSESREANEGEYYLVLDGTFSLGRFLFDGFSLQFMPGIFMMHRVSDHGDYTYSDLYLTLAGGCDYYFGDGAPMAFSVGLDAGVDIIPGIDGKNGGAEDPDDSMALQFNVIPNAAAYFFLSERVATYFSLCPEFFNYKQIKNDIGDSIEYADGKGFMDYWRLMLHVNIGMKYFLPAGSRFLDGKEKPFTEIFKMD